MSKKILIVEDDEAICRNLQELLELDGYTVDKAFHGREALDRLKASPVLPSLIILDLMMPVMDGFEFRKEQELDPRFSKIPVVVITAGGNIESKTMKIGARAFLRKPFDIDNVLKTVKRFAS